MDIKQFLKHLATNSPKKLNEAANYTVVRTETIPHEETHTGLAGTKKTIKNPNGGAVVVLLKFNDGYTTTGVGKNKNEAIKDAVSSKLALFGESFTGDNKAAIIGLPRLKDTKKMAASVEDVMKRVENKTTSNVAKKQRLLNNLKELHSMLASNRIDPDEIDILQNEIVSDLNKI